ncbi:hypothetical protein [Methyloglobulus sp.]|uniref:DUF6933 domain-containing protein n=1 Tax=Methyloglobulus sp. TaxID=2518622 RepID=UPI0032B7D431
MIQFRCTKKVQDFLGVKPRELCEIKEPDSVLGNWYVNTFKIGHRNLVIYMNERTLLSFILVGVKKSESIKIISGFSAGLAQLLKAEGFSGDQINHILPHEMEIELTKTSDKSLLGNMNDLVYLYCAHIAHSEDSLGTIDIGEIIMKINRTPQRVINWKYSIDVAREVIRIKAI